MDTKHLKAVIAVARHGSFTRAARELYMSQSTLSRQVMALERELGAELFVRGLPAVSLTDEGQAFLREAERVLEAVARAEEAAGRRLPEARPRPAPGRQPRSGGRSGRRPGGTPADPPGAAQ